MRFTPNRTYLALGVASVLGLSSFFASRSNDLRLWRPPAEGRARPFAVQLGPRPYYLVENMPHGPLKEKLASCEAGPFEATGFSIGHRGAPLQFPEHTRQSYEAAARMGAGVIECDVTFTRDRQLVCRHSQCDLHTTTNILSTPLAARCSVPPDPASPTPFAKVHCCTSDITLAEFKTLCGKMDAGDPQAATLQKYMAATPAFRTDLYATCGTLLSHAESIRLFRELGVAMTPELKEPQVPMPFEGKYTQEQFAQQLIDEYVAAGISASQVSPQSFRLDDLRYWRGAAPAFGERAVWLDGRYADATFDPNEPSTWQPSMDALAEQGVHVIAPPLWVLLTPEKDHMVPSAYARAAREAGLEIVAWSLERSGPLAGGGGDYHRSVAALIHRDGDTFQVLDVLAKDVGVRAVFSDWPATTTYYANCMGL